MLLHLCDHGAIRKQILRPSGMIGGIKQVGGEFFRKFPRQTEDIPHIERAGVHKHLMGFHPDER